MIEKLNIKNGNLELEFNEYNYEYTVLVDEDVLTLDFDYVIKDDVKINIINNTLNNDENIVYFVASKDKDTKTYKFYVRKSNEESVSYIDDYLKTLELKESPNYFEIKVLAISVFLIILLLFVLIFKKRKI